jgi:hypothetical protein
VRSSPASSRSGAAADAEAEFLLAEVALVVADLHPHPVVAGGINARSTSTPRSLTVACGRNRSVRSIRSMPYSNLKLPGTMRAPGAAVKPNSRRSGIGTAVSPAACGAMTWIAGA